MVNPQLGQIRDLPSVSGIQAFNPKASELQNAISSISNETNDLEVSQKVFTQIVLLYEFH